MEEEEIIEILTDIFSENRVEDLESNGEIFKNKFNVESWENLIKIPGYKESYDSILKLKRVVERLENYMNIKDQLYHSLDFVKEIKERSSCDVEILNKIIKKTLYKNWSEIEKKDYDDVFGIIVNWKHFFLSYTNRNCYETNQDLNKLIYKVYPRTTENKKDEISLNCVAKLIAKFLTEENLRAFYDKDSIKCGDDFEDEIRIHCKSTFTFVQLIEKIIFNEPDDGKINWCHEEFLEFEKNNRKIKFYNSSKFKQNYFLLTKGSLEEVMNEKLILPQYKKWYERVKKSHSLFLKEYIKNKDGLRLEISKIAVEIKKTRKNIITQILQNLK
jgi:hypothetical protein